MESMLREKISMAGNMELAANHAQVPELTMRRYH